MIEGDTVFEEQQNMEADKLVAMARQQLTEPQLWLRPGGSSFAGKQRNAGNAVNLA